MAFYGPLFLALSMTVLVGFTVFAVAVLRVNKSHFDSDRDFVRLSPFWIFLIGFFVATVFMYLPIYIADYFHGENGFVKAIESILISVHNTMRMFILDGEFDIIRDAMNAEGVDTVFACVFKVYAAAMYVTAPILSANFVLRFFRSASAFLRYCSSRCTEVYLISELNERSIALALDIISGGKKANGAEREEGKRKKTKRLVVFTDVFDRDEERDFELISRATRMGAICLKRDITAIGFKQHRRDILRKIYFIGDDENENISQALATAEKCLANPVYNTDKTEMYVFARSAESEILLNSAETGNIKVRRINENRNLVTHTLCNHSIYADAMKAAGVELDEATVANRTIPKKKIPMNIVVVGCGGYGTELIKTLCCMGQMPGFELTVHVFDKFDAKKQLRAECPELVDKSGDRRDGFPYYKLCFHNKTDVAGYEFMEKIAALKNVTTAFVTLGNDELNVDTALRMRRQFGRGNIANSSNIPPILAVVFSLEKSNTAKQHGLVNERDADYGVRFIGDMATCYSVKNIEREELEELGRAYHTQYADAKLEAAKKAGADTEEYVNELEKERRRYNKYEYFRRASVMRAVFYEYRWQLGYVPKSGDTNEDRAFNAMLIDFEHRRWSAYVRAEGYVYAEKRDDIAKTHNKLVATAALEESDKGKDDLRRMEHGYEIIKPLRFKHSTQTTSEEQT